MSRLRFNNSIGTLGGSLTSTATTVTFASSPGWPTVVAPDIVPLVIDPPGSTPNTSFEIVWVTAYTAGTTTATIVRGQESTSPVSHANGAQWMMAPTAGDFPIGLSYTPATVLPPSRAYRNAAFTFTTNTWTKVPLDTVSFDPNGYFSVAQGRYNVPAAGYYQVSGSLFANGQYVLVAIYKNGSPWSFAEDELGSGSTGSANVSDVVPCNAGDYLELWVFSNVTTLSAQGSQGNNLSVIPLTQQSIASQITPVVARAFRSAAYTATTNAWTKVPFDAVSYDTSSAFSVANSRFIAPAAGWYEVSGALTLSGSNEQVAIYKNGVEVSRGGQGASNFTDVVTDLIQCNVGDYLELWYFTTSGFSTLATGNFFTVAQVSAVPGANLAAARAYRNAALSLTTSTWTKVPLDTVSFDPNGNMDVTTNHRYNVPAAGPYLVTGQVEPPGNSSAVGVYKNGSLVAQGGYLSGTTGDVVVTDIVQCNAGDYLELWIFGGSGGTVTGGASRLNYFSVTPLVSAVASTPGFSSSGSQSAATNVGSAYKASGSPSLTSGVWTKVAIDTVSFDPAGAFDVATNHRYNVPIAGYYQVSGQVAISSTTGMAGVYKNGSLAMEGSGSAQGSCSGLLYCNAGDYLELYAFANGTGTLSTGGPYADFLSVALIQAPSGSGNANALPAGASYQNGIINSTDLAISALSINTSTGALTFTLASAVPVIIKDASGLLIPVTFTGSTFTLIPPTLPTTSNSRVIGVEIDTNGQVSLVSGASVSGQQSTASTIETNTASITPGRLRVADIGVYNNAGAYNFSNASTTATQGTNWVDRRPWARGANNELVRKTQAGGAYGYPGSSQVIDATNLAIRMECTGAPLRIRWSTTFDRASGSGSTQVQIIGMMDGAEINTNECAQAAWSNAAGDYVPMVFSYLFTPSAGSHLFAPWWSAITTGLAELYATANFPFTFAVEEVLKTNANNGTV